MRFQGLRALVVDADSSNAKLLQVILRAEGADATTASSAEAALSLFASFRPRLVITELEPASIDGLELARKLRTTDASLAIVVVTSLNGPDAADRARAAGADEYVRKPIDPIEIVTTIHRVLGTGENA